MRLLSYFLLLIFGIFSCQPTPATEEEIVQEEENAHLGEVQITVTGDSAALPHFYEGLLLLHSFEYEDARTAFEAAQEADSTMLMAYWGEAMTHNHPLWRQQDGEAALEALNRLAPTPEERAALAQTPIEGNLLHALEILYNEDGGTKQERDKAYSEYLGELRELYPDQHEIAAFYALSVLGAVPVGRDVEAYEKSARIAAGIMAENPKHPGALHYMIHAYDDPAHAPKAIAAANSYSKVAPAAAHALHMPSHIYVSIGMWNEVISSNIASWDASVARMERMELDDNARSFHALHWLMYGLTQQGKYAEAQQLINDLHTYTKEDPSKRSKSYMVTMAANYQVETADWNKAEVLTMDTIDIAEHNILLKAIRHFTKGQRAFLNKDAQKLEAIIAEMLQERKDAANQVTSSGAPMCSAAGSSRSLPNQMDIDQAKVLSLELEALHAILSRDNELAEQHMRAAVELEQATSYAYGPPRIVQPSYEFYGQWLLTQQRAEEAALQFDYALSKGPKRLHALYGAWQAAIMMNDNEKAEEYASMLRENLRHADEEVKKRFSYSSFDMAS